MQFYCQGSHPLSRRGHGRPNRYLTQTLCTNFFKVGATRKLQGCNFLVKSNYDCDKEVASVSYPQHTAPTSFEVGATRKMQGCNFIVKSDYECDKEVAAVSYPQHSAPTSFEVGATIKLQGCNFIVRAGSDAQSFLQRHGCRVRLFAYETR